MHDIFRKLSPTNPGLVVLKGLKRTYGKTVRLETDQGAANITAQHVACISQKRSESLLSWLSRPPDVTEVESCDDHSRKRTRQLSMDIVSTHKIRDGNRQTF